jgi:hypothetical protein
MPMTLAMFDMAATSVDDTSDGRPLPFSHAAIASGDAMIIAL